MRKKSILLLGLCGVLMSVTACGKIHVSIGDSTTAAEETTEAETTKEETTKEETTEEETTEEETTKEETTEEETTEEETKEEKKTNKNTNKITDLSDDIYDFQVSIDGTVYQCPFPYEQLMDDGWKYSGDDTEKVRANAYGVSDWFKKDSLKFMTDIVNFDVNEIPMSECYIGGIIINKADMKDAVAEIALPKGIILGESTMDDVKEAYGDPSNTYEGTYSSSLTYEMDTYNYVKISVGTESGVVEGIEIRNFTQPEDFETGEVDSSVPAIVEAYKAPKELGDDLTVYNVEFAGDLYTLPAPVSAFVDNGWKIMEDAEGTEVAGKDYAWITIMKNNQKLKVIVNNYSTNATTIENCFFTNLKADEYGCKVDMSIPNGISTGMSEDDLLAALSDTTYKTESSASFTYYTVEDIDSIADGLSFTIKEGKLIGIEVKYQPKLSKFYKALGVQE